MNITLTSTGNLKPNLMVNPSLFTHVKSALSVNDDINTCGLTSRHACQEIIFAFKKKIGSLSEGIAFRLYSFQWVNHTFDVSKSIVNEVKNRSEIAGSSFLSAK
jgi:hypothetical protein